VGNMAYWVGGAMLGGNDDDLIRRGYFDAVNGWKCVDKKLADSDPKQALTSSIVSYQQSQTAIGSMSST